MVGMERVRGWLEGGTGDGGRIGRWEDEREEEDGEEQKEKERRKEGEDEEGEAKRTTNAEDTMGLAGPGKSDRKTHPIPTVVTFCLEPGQSRER